MSRRKAEMVLELIDRATGPARRFIALQARMGKAVEAANRMAGRSYRAAERATNIYKRAVQGLDRAQDALQRGIRRSNDLIRRQIMQMRTATGLMRSGLAGTGQAALLAGGMFAAYAGTVSAAGVAMLGPARQFEKFQTILTTTEGSAAAAQEAMGWVEDFAVKTPYELDQVMAAFVQLRAYGLDPTNGLLETLGNTSAAMGKDIGQAVEAIADAVTGENERLKEFGVKAAKVGDYFEYTYNVDGVEKKVRALAGDRAAIEATLKGIFDERFSGAMEKLAGTFDGMLSNIMDQWVKFQRMIMDNGVFDWMKSKLKLVLDELDRLSASGELELWAKRIADHILTGLKAIWNFGAAAVRFWKALYPWLQSAADALGGWRNLALAVVAIPFRGVILGAAFSLLRFAGGALLAMRALAGIGFASAAGGALRIGSVMLGLLNPLKLIRGAFIALRVAIISTGIGALVVGLAMAGLWIYNNWSGLMAFFKGFGETFMESLGPARPLAEGVIRVMRRLFDWIGRLVKPLDASAEQWRDWGRAAGRFVGEALSDIAGFFRRIRDWVANMGQIDWGDFIGNIDWPVLLGGAFMLSTLIRPIIWTAKLIGAPVKWALLGGKFAMSALIRPIVWTAALLGAPVKWALLGGKFLLSTLLTPIKWGAALISKVPWLSLAGGGAKFALKGLVMALKWGSKLIPGIGWAVLAGELLWHLLIKKIDWSSFEWLKFNWRDILPDWIWGDIIPDLPQVDFDTVAKESMVPSGSLDPSQLTEEQRKILERHNKFREKVHGISAPEIEIKDPATLLEAARAAETLETQFPRISAAATAALQAVSTALTQIATAFAATDYTSEGARLMQGLADGIRSKTAEVVAAVQAITEGIRNALPQSASLNIAAQPVAPAQAGAPVQARAQGGAFSPGWLLTGERGPELEYRSEGGFIAHNRALRNMAGLSRMAVRNAAMASGIVAGVALPAAADAPEGRAGIAGRYQGAATQGPVSVSAPITLNVQGNVDQNSLPALKAALVDALEERVIARLKRDARATTRQGYK